MTAFFTFAYNASATLSRAIKSVLRQTCPDWVYYLCDDGSTSDHTRDIIKKYAKKDSRIIPIYMDHNDPYEASRIGFSKIFTSDAKYFAMLDADDEYDPQFLEKSLKFMEDASLDIVASGNYFIDAQSMRKLSVRKLEQKIILQDKRSYNDFFPMCHQFMRTIWGKLYKVSLFQNFDYCDADWDYYKVPYGGDTIFFMQAALYANRIGILNEALHKYYLSHKRSSYNWNPLRPEADRTLYDHAINFLNAKVGLVSNDNKDFLDVVYINAVNDTLKVLLQADLGTEKKLHALRDIFSSQYTISAITNEHLQISGLVEGIFNTIKLFPETRAAEDGIWLGMTLSALLEDQTEYIQYSIYHIDYLITERQTDEAEQELAEWEKLLPDHAALKKLRQKLEQYQIGKKETASLFNHQQEKTVQPAGSETDKFECCADENTGEEA